MAYDSLNTFIDQLEKEGELIRIKEFVNPQLEITEITDRFSKEEDGGKALLFENTGTNFPLLINAFGSSKRMNLALGVDALDDIGKRIEDLLMEVTSPKASFMDKLKLLPTLKNISSFMPRKRKGRGKSQEVMMNPVDMHKLPVLTCWPSDGGPFVTLPMVITKDPENNIRNVGMYRMQVFDEKLTGMHWHKHKVGARHFEEYKRLKKKMPVAVALGGDPALTYAATAPLPDNIDEFLMAGFLRNKPVDMVKAVSQDIDVPADADIIIEGYIDPEEDFIWEGPFGDHTGFYSLADWYPKFHITAITHRKDAVYPATIVGIPPMEDAWIAKATERIFLSPIKFAFLPEIIDIDMPAEGVAHNLVIVKIKKTYPGQAIKAAHALWGAGQMMFTKVMIVVDEQFSAIHNYKELVKHLLEQMDPATDFIFSKGPLDILDHSSSKQSFGSKLAIDATTKFPEELDENESSGRGKELSPSDINDLMNSVPAIRKVNPNPLQTRSPLLVFGIDKQKMPVEEVIEEIKKRDFFRSTGVILLYDDIVDIGNLHIMSWLLLGNIDPYRDIFLEEYGRKGMVIIDATMKNNARDSFKRDWPNIIAMERKIVENIDKKWDQLNLGPHIESPSRDFINYLRGEGAIARD